MSAITIENDLVHYEVLGRGRPVIFVHGWLGSWRYWVPTMQQLSVKYRTYALDLWGFGDTGKDATRYDFKTQVRLLNDFMEKLGITKAALVGHSLGAAICLRYASQFPDRAPRVALISAPLFDLGGLEGSAAMPASAVAPAAQAMPAPVVAAPVAATPVPASTPVTNSPTPSAPPAAIPAPVVNVTSTPVTTTPVAPTPAPASGSVPVSSAAAPSDTPAPVPVAASQPATPAPSAQPTSPSAAPVASAPATSNQPSTPATAPAATSQTQSPSPNHPPTPGSSSSASDTIPRNPFRGLGDTPEEILARLQARNTASAAGTGAPAPTQANPVPPGAPALPTSIATPILTKPTGPLVSPPPPPPAPAVPSAPGRTTDANPLLSILTGVKPGALLTKYVDRDAPDLDKLRAEVEKTDEAAITKSAQSFGGVNLALELHRLPSPTLLLHGKDDPLLPAPSDELIMRIARGKPAGHLLAFVEPDLRHFPMLEITAKFNRLLMDFLDAQDLNNVQFKDQWRRTMR